MNTLERAEDLEAEVTAILVAEAIDNVTATSDLAAVPAALANGPVVVVQPPKIEFINYSVRQYTWELFVIAGPTRDRMKAWELIDPILTALAAPLSLTDAEPATFSHPGMAEHAAYVLTFTETI